MKYDDCVIQGRMADSLGGVVIMKKLSHIEKIERDFERLKKPDVKERTEKQEMFWGIVTAIIIISFVTLFFMHITDKDIHIQYTESEVWEKVEITGGTIMLDIDKKNIICPNNDVTFDRSYKSASKVSLYGCLKLVNSNCQNEGKICYIRKSIKVVVKP